MRFKKLLLQTMSLSLVMLVSLALPAVAKSASGDFWSPSEGVSIRQTVSGLSENDSAWQ